MKAAVIALLLVAVAAGAFYAGRISAPKPPEPVPAAPIPEAKPVPVAPVEKPPEFSAAFKARLNTFVEKASELAAATKTGINLNDLTEKLAALQGAYDLAAVLWPQGKLTAQKEDAGNMIYTYQVILKAWQNQSLRGDSTAPIVVTDKDFPEPYFKTIVERNPNLRLHKMMEFEDFSKYPPYHGSPFENVPGSTIRLGTDPNTIGVLMADASNQVSQFVQAVLPQL